MRRALPLHSNAVWPPLSLVALIITVYGILDGGIWLIEHAFQNVREDISDMPEIVNIRTIILTMAAGLYAVQRLWRFHPACNQAYAAWLKLSPWTPDKPLPLGPIHLVWQDVVVVGVITAIATWHAHINPALPGVVFGLVYLAGMSLLLAFTRTWKHCLVMGFLWPAMILPEMKGPPMIGLVAAMIVVAWQGHRKSLRSFPWEPLMSSNRPNGSTATSVMQIEMRTPGLNNAAAIQKASNVGWPYLPLSPKVEYHSISTSRNFFTSVLVGWWAFCAIRGLEIGSVPEWILFFAVLAAFFRVTIYYSGIAPSFNLWGRITSGRVVVPGFDKVFLTPLAVVFLAIAGGMIIRGSGSWYPATESCVIALIWFVLFNGRPTLRKWLLTGQHRYRPPARLGGNRQLLKSI